MPDQKTDKKMTIGRLVGRAFLWAFIVGLGVSVFLYGLAYFFGETEKSFLIAFYWGPITAVVMFTAMLFFQLPRAMNLSKGPFAVYLTIVTLPILGLGALFLWWLFGM